MWKYVTRRIRDSVERSANHFDRCTTTVVNECAANFNDEKKMGCPMGPHMGPPTGPPMRPPMGPSMSPDMGPHEGSGVGQDMHKHWGPPCKWLLAMRTNGCKAFHRNGNGTNNKRWNFGHLNKSWRDAITWSGALVLGFYTSQLIHLKLKRHCRLQQKRGAAVNNLLSSIYPVLTNNKNDLYVDSICKIGKVVSEFAPTVYLMSNDQNGCDKDKANSSGSSTSPDTSDGDLGEVLNSIENRLGLAAIEHGQYQEGLTLLRSAANRNHAPAMYNLGLCYELGLGVTVNENMAMEFYKSAAALDHPGALYNLGIYYGQGRAGLKTDQETATRLLRLAAVQGQQDAIDALKSLGVNISDPRHNDINSWSYQRPLFSSTENIIPAPTRLFVDNLNFLQARV